MSQWLFKKGGLYVAIQFTLFGIIWLAPGSQVDSWSDISARIGRIISIPLLLYAAVMMAGGLLSLGINVRAEPHPSDAAKLVTGGVFGIVRHPIYSAIVVGWVGWGLFNAAEVTIVLVLGLLLPFFAVKTRSEERMLGQRFPDYSAYQKRVTKLIPWIY